MAEFTPVPLCTEPRGCVLCLTLLGSWHSQPHLNTCCGVMGFCGPHLQPLGLGGALPQVDHKQFPLAAGTISHLSPRDTAPTWKQTSFQACSADHPDKAQVPPLRNGQREACCACHSELSLVVAPGVNSASIPPPPLHSGSRSKAIMSSKPSSRQL